MPANGWEGSSRAPHHRSSKASTVAAATVLTASQPMTELARMKTVVLPAGQRQLASMKRWLSTPTPLFSGAGLF